MGSMRLANVPTRLAAGLFILNSGLSKRSADDETAKQLHGFAVGTYPFLGKLDAATFTKLLSSAEIALGTALLTPVLPTKLVGAGLTAFSGGLLGLYLNTPGMRSEDGIRPTQEGIALAKDSWLVGIGLSLMMTPRKKKKKKSRAAAAS